MATAEDILGVELTVSQPAQLVDFYQLLEIPHRPETVRSGATDDGTRIIGPRLVPSRSDSLKGRCLPPRRGLVGLIYDTNSIAEIRRRVEGSEGRGLGCRVVAASRGLIQPRGALESLLVQAPNGILHQFVARR